MKNLSVYIGPDSVCHHDLMFPLGLGVALFGKKVAGPVTGFLSAATSRTAVTAGSATMGFLGGGVAEAHHFDGKGE